MADSLIDFNLLEQIAALVWARTGDSRMAEKLGLIKLGCTLWSKLSSQDTIDALRAETILNISAYVKDNPRASQEQLSNEIGKQIMEFAKKVEERFHLDKK